LYAPNEEEERATLWDRIDEYIPKVDWLLCGDFNNVESQDDNIGVNTVSMPQREHIT
jgi:hypothetical protein